MSKPNGILAMNPEKYREIDGVVFDEASYARHCQPKTEEAPSPETAPEASEPAQSAGSYVTSYTTSYRTSYSGSGSGSFRFGSGSCPVGGYGLELI